MHWSLKICRFLPSSGVDLDDIKFGKAQVLLVLDSFVIKIFKSATIIKIKEICKYLKLLLHWLYDILLV